MTTAGPAAIQPGRGTARAILALAAPTTLISALQAGAHLAETFLAARQGADALAGWALVLPFALLLRRMSVGAMGGGYTVMSDNRIVHYGLALCLFA